MALLAGIQGTIEAMVAMLMWQNARMNPLATLALTSTQRGSVVHPVPTPQPGEGSISVKLAEFLKLHPLSYSNLEDLEDPLEFLDKIEKIRVTLGCANNRMVEFATFQLKGKANDWWMTWMEADHLGGV